MRGEARTGRYDAYGVQQLMKKTEFAKLDLGWWAKDVREDPSIVPLRLHEPWICQISGYITYKSKTQLQDATTYPVRGYASDRLLNTAQYQSTPNERALTIERHTPCKSRDDLAQAGLAKSLQGADVRLRFSVHILSYVLSQN